MRAGLTGAARAFGDPPCNPGLDPGPGFLLELREGNWVPGRARDDGVLGAKSAVLEATLRGTS